VTVSLPGPLCSWIPSLEVVTIRRSSRPRTAAGIFASLLVAPFVIGIGLAVWNGAITTVFGALMVVVSLLLCAALPAHFFIGYRVRWILPALAAVMALGATFLGLVQRDWRLVIWGVPLAIGSLGWLSVGLGASRRAIDQRKKLGYDDRAAP
jgi:hypothetical protein